MYGLYSGHGYVGHMLPLTLSPPASAQGSEDDSVEDWCIISAKAALSSLGCC